MRQILTFTVALFLIASNYARAHDLELNGVVYDDDTVAELITVITATSPTISMPNTTHIYPAQVSLHRIPALAKAKKIIAFDGIPPGEKHLEAAYNKYK